MRKNLLLIILGFMLSFSGAIYAASTTSDDYQYQGTGESFYGGIQAGYASMGYDKSWLMKKKLSITGIDRMTNKGYAGNIYFGYGFNPYFAMEVGYLATPKITFENIHDGADILDDNFYHNITYLTLRGNLLFTKRFAAFGKVGGAWIYRRRFSNNGIDIAIQQNYVSAILSLGLQFNITPRAAMDLSCTTVSKVNDLPITYFCGIGGSYKFWAD